MTVSDLSVWEGWGRLAAQENWFQMPVWVEKSVHPQCEQPSHTWAMLVGVQREREALFSGERLPREVMGFPTATMDQAVLYLDRLSQHFAQNLAWGTYSDEW